MPAKGVLDEPTMSDTTILVTVEDLIDRAMGASDVNIVNFKLVQAILHILARQQRMLTQRVEIRITELKKKTRDDTTESSTEISPQGRAYKSPQRPAQKEREMVDRQGRRKSTKLAKESTQFGTKQTHMMVHKEGEEEEETEEYIIKKKIKQERSEKTPQIDKEEKTRKKDKYEIEKEDKKRHGKAEMQEVETKEAEIEGRGAYDEIPEKGQRRQDKAEKMPPKEERTKIVSQAEREESEEDEIEARKDYEKMPEKEKRRQERAETVPHTEREETEEDKIEARKGYEKMSEKEKRRQEEAKNVSRTERKESEEDEPREGYEKLPEKEKSRQERAKSVHQTEREESEEAEMEKRKGYEKLPEKEKRRQERTETVPHTEREETEEDEEKMPEKEQRRQERAKTGPQAERGESEYEIESREGYEKMPEKEQSQERAKTGPQAVRGESEYDIESREGYEKMPEKEKRSQERTKTVSRIDREESEEDGIEQRKGYEKMPEKEQRRQERAKTGPQAERGESEYEIESREGYEKMPEKEQSQERAKTGPQAVRGESEYDIELREGYEKIPEKEKRRQDREKTVPHTERAETEEGDEKMPDKEKKRLDRDKNGPQREEPEEAEQRKGYEKLPEKGKRQQEKGDESEEYEQRKDYDKMPQKEKRRSERTKIVSSIGKEDSEEDENEQLKEYKKMPEKEKKSLETGPQREESEEVEQRKDYEIITEIGKRQQEKVIDRDESDEKKQERAEKIPETERIEEKKDQGKRFGETEKKIEKEKLSKEEKKEPDTAEKIKTKGKEKFEREEKQGQEKAETITSKEIKFEKGEKKEQDKTAKITPTEKEKIEKKEKKGQEKAEKMSKKEKETSESEEMKDERPKQGKLAEKYQQKTEKDRSPVKETKLERTKPAQRSRYNIEITEKIVDNEKILVVEKGPTTRIDAHSGSSIDVVTQSQFALLESAVKQLMRMAAPLQLQLPDNKQLMSDVMSGTATLPDAMTTLQISARLTAAEAAMVRMAGLIQQLIAAGELPEDIAERLEAVLEPSLVDVKTQADQLYQRGGERGGEHDDRADKSHPLTGKKSVVIDAKTSKSRTSKISKGIEAEPYAMGVDTGTPDVSVASRPSTVSRASRVSSVTAGKGVPCVTYDEMKAALKDLRDDILKCLNNMSGRATTSAETALHTAKLVAEKLDIALKLDDRISFLQSVVGDYAEQLNGFDSGLTTQMLSFQDQMAQMRTDLKAGLLQLENVNNNAETAAVLELTERYDELANELDSTLHAHKALTTLQEQLSAEMRSLVECMEMLREQKADRDEVLDGLRDKADSSKLAGLLTEAEFAEARADFERRINLCYDKFNRQDSVWQKAIRDLKHTADKKAELVELLSARDDAQRQLQDLNDKIKVLAAVLGEPKAALLTRKLAEGATCGACHERALMEPREAAHGAPRLLPALRPSPTGASEEPCVPDWQGAGALDERHMCHRWCGGSHTLIGEFTRHAQATPVPQGQLTKKFVGYGDDGRLYKMEEECQPCLECNPLKEETPEPAPGHGAGDMAAETVPAPDSTI